VAEKFGSTSLPATVTTPAGDLGLGFLGAYLQAVMNAHLAGAWAAVAPLKEPVRSVFYEEPKAAIWTEDDLPALFLYRGEAIGEQWADEWLVQRTALTAQWIFPPDVPYGQARRAPFVTAVHRSLFVAIELGRHPAYVAAGDTDPTAATRGTFVYGPNFLNPVALEFKSARPAQLAVPMSDGPSRTYQTIEMKLSLAEVWEEDLTGYDPQTSLDASVETEEGTVIATQRFTD
jgi:hypothetical protein